MISKEIRKILREHKIKNTVKTRGLFVYVTLKQKTSNEVLEQVKKLETIESHGDLIDDTRWYCGHGIQFKFDYSPIPEVWAKYEQIIESFYCLNINAKEVEYHASKKIIEVLGESDGKAILDKVNLYEYYRNKAA